MFEEVDDVIFVDGIFENRSMQNEKYLFVPISDPKD